jgi:hypothetical protein
LLAIIIAIASAVFGYEAVTGQISKQVSAAMSPETAKQVEEMVASASGKKNPFSLPSSGSLRFCLEQPVCWCSCKNR